MSMMTVSDCTALPQMTSSHPYQTYTLNLSSSVKEDCLHIPSSVRDQEKKREIRHRTKIMYGHWVDSLQFCPSRFQLVSSTGGKLTFPQHPAFVCPEKELHVPGDSVPISCILQSGAAWFEHRAWPTPWGARRTSALPHRTQPPSTPHSATLHPHLHTWEQRALPHIWERVHFENKRSCFQNRQQ